MTISANWLLREMADDYEHHGADERDDERPGVGPHREWLHEHDDAKGDEHGGEHFPGAAAQAGGMRGGGGSTIGAPGPGSRLKFVFVK